MDTFSPQNRNSTGSTPKFLSPLSKSTTEYLHRYKKSDKDKELTSPNTSDTIKDISYLIEQYQVQASEEDNYKISCPISPIKTPLIKLTRNQKKELIDMHGGILNTPLPIKTPTRTFDLMMVTPKTNYYSKEQMPVLQPMNLTFATPMFKNGKATSHINEDNNEPLNYEDTCSMDKIEKIVEIFSLECGDIAPWLKCMKTALTKDQIEILLDGKIDAEDIENVLEISVKRGCLEKISQEGESYYRLCAMV